jgi:hypothetical protein
MLVRFCGRCNCGWLVGRERRESDLAFSRPSGSREIEGYLHVTCFQHSRISCDSAT